jgi:hypothetical protein
VSDLPKIFCSDVREPEQTIFPQVAWSARERQRVARLLLASISDAPHIIDDNLRAQLKGLSTTRPRQNNKRKRRK